jgi:hypothetical protein
MRDPIQILTGWEDTYRADIERRALELDSADELDFRAVATLASDQMLCVVLSAILDQFRYVDAGLPRTDGVARRLRAIWNALSGKGVA